MKTRYVDQSPWEEVWFLEVTLPDGRGLWLRYTLCKGEHGEAGVWATWFDGEPRGWHRAFEPKAFAHDEDCLAELGDCSLSMTRAIGRCGPLEWDLHLHASGGTHRHVPKLLTTLGLGRTYEPAILDAQVRGVLTLDGTPHVVVARGVLGHVFGGRNRLASWVWAHAAGFDDAPDVVFEGLSVRLGSAHMRPITSVVLVDGDRVHRFSRMRDLVRTRSTFGQDTWRFRATNPSAQLWGEVQLPARTALAAYTDPDGRPLWCRNAPGARIDLELRTGDTRQLWTSTRAVAEIAGRIHPGGPITLP